MQDNFSDGPNNSKSAVQNNLKQLDLQFSKYEEVLSLLHNCSLCGSQLEFVYTIELPGSLIREEAKCNHCEIRIRDKLFNIQ